MTLGNNKLFGKQRWKTSFWKSFSFTKIHRKGFKQRKGFLRVTHSYSADILMKILVELNCHTRKQVKVHRAISDIAQLFSRKIDRPLKFSSLMLVFTFPDSTEHRMPKNWKYIRKHVSCFCMTQKSFLNRCCVRKDDHFASSNSTFDVEALKPFLKTI